MPSRTSRHRWPASDRTTPRAARAAAPRRCAPPATAARAAAASRRATDSSSSGHRAVTRARHGRRAMRRYRVLFVNDTARNGGPGRSLQIILKFVDPRVVHRGVVLPRAGAGRELLVPRGVVDELHFEPHIVENVVAPLTRAMRRDDFAAPLAVRTARAVANAGRAALGLVRLARLVRDGRYDLIYCNGTTADFA